MLGARDGGVELGRDDAIDLGAESVRPGRHRRILA
jgi:hypothetical protein